MYKRQTLPAYFKEWMEVYKKDAVADSTYAKYVMTFHWLEQLVPAIRLNGLTRIEYQKMINAYAQTHERQTVLYFHHQIKSALADACDNRLLTVNPARKVIIKGTVQRQHKVKFLSQAELSRLIKEMQLGAEISWDHLLLLIAKTGLRFAEALGLTPDDFDFQKRLISITKTWNYKSKVGSFAPTKNKSSMRVVTIDGQLAALFARLTDGKRHDSAIFTSGRRVYNATVNDRLRKLCRKADVPVISVHGLRHTHASILLYAGVSTASVAKRLGHSSMTTTQNTYLHIIRELESRDDERILKVIGDL